jgi:hypothetical protein
MVFDVTFDDIRTVFKTVKEDETLHEYMSTGRTYYCEGFDISEDTRVLTVLDKIPSYILFV